MQHIQIRPASTQDEAFIRNCAEAAYGQYVAAIGRPPAPMVADFANQIAAGQAHVAISPDGQAVGYVVFYPEGPAMHLEAVAVVPDATGQGIGKLLIQFCENAALRSGLRTVQLYTNQKMVANLSIYPHLGFTEVGRRSEDGFERIYYEKTLA